MRIKPLKGYEKVVESYKPFAEQVGISEEDLERLILSAGFIKEDAPKCVRCVNSRANKKINRESVENQGCIKIYARVCVFGLDDKNCNMFKPLAEVLEEEE